MSCKDCAWRRGAVVTFVFAAFFFILLSHAAFAVNPNCNSTAVPAGAYSMVSALTCTGNFSLQNNITVQCNGYSINGATYNMTLGGVTNVTFTDCAISNFTSINEAGGSPQDIFFYNSTVIDMSLLESATAVEYFMYEWLTVNVSHI